MQDTAQTTPEITFEIIPAELGLAPEAKQSLECSFASYFEQARQIKEQAGTITSAKVARVARLEVKALRIAAEKTRKELKEDSLRMGKAIDGANNILLAMIVPIEKQLEDIEKAEERAELARIAALHEERFAKIAPFRAPEAFPYTNHNLGRLDETTWAMTLQEAKDLHELRQERARKAEAERIAREQAEAAERERLRVENERLKAEAAEREAKAKAEREAAERAQREAAEKARKEREAIEAKAKAEREAAERELARIKAESEAAAKREREAREAVERELAAKKAAEEAAAAKAAAAAKKAKAAPDKAKLRSIAEVVRKIEVPEVGTAEAKTVASDIAAKIKSFANWIETQTESL